MLNVKCAKSKDIWFENDFCSDGYIREEVEYRSGWNWTAEGVVCNKCGYKLQTTGLPSYCPNCHSKMEVQVRWC